MITRDERPALASSLSRILGTPRVTADLTERYCLGLEVGFSGGGFVTEADLLDDEWRNGYLDGVRLEKLTRQSRELMKSAKR